MRMATLVSSWQTGPMAPSAAASNPLGAWPSASTPAERKSTAFQRFVSGDNRGDVTWFVLAHWYGSSKGMTIVMLMSVALNRENLY